MIALTRDNLACIERMKCNFEDLIATNIVMIYLDLNIKTLLIAFKKLAVKDFLGS